MVNNFVLVSAIIYNICQVKQDISYKKQLTEKTTVIRNYQQQVNKFSFAFSSKLLCPFILLSILSWQGNKLKGRRVWSLGASCLLKPLTLTNP